MNTQQHAGNDERMVRQYDYDDSRILAADVGAAAGDVDVDVVGTTAIVVAETDSGVTETEFELPEGDTTVEARNGIVTVEVER